MHWLLRYFVNSKGKLFIFLLKKTLDTGTIQMHLTKISITPNQNLRFR